jgi:hypothetical protein
MIEDISNMKDDRAHARRPTQRADERSGFQRERSATTLKVALHHVHAIRIACSPCVEADAATRARCSEHARHTSPARMRALSFVVTVRRTSIEMRSIS